MKNANTTAALSFSPESITVNGRTFPASYSLARTGDVYVFASVKTAADAEALPVRLHISANMPMHAEAVAAAEAARKASKPAAQEAAPVSVPVLVQEAPAPADKPADKPAPAKKASRKTAKAETISASKPTVQEAAPVSVPVLVQEAPAPADKPAPVQENAAPAGKAWIGTTLQGKGWSIAFDAAAGRTRVQVDGTPTDAQRNAIEQAGFYWSAQLQSWNKKLTCKAYRAAQALACTLNALA